ncbi:hypothetical protein Y1Q_0023664 [Alligator mississippiensis]|uniref:C-type lectin domain-containing protein n=1 Tax=Alligator mississippiensis TaxID=8496 RepID=A0A151P224_ALLMI|nr:hypothetical protein Y1Q_0023664 [Alligator mississippiensis]
MVQGCNDSRTQSQGQIFCRHPKALCIIVIIALVLLALLLGLCGIPWLHGTPQQNTTTLMPFSSPPNSIAETLFFSSTKLNYSACHNFCQDQGWELLGPDVAQAQQEHYKTTWVQTPSTKDQPWTCYYLEDGEQRESSCTVTRPCHCREASAPASPQN